jgi:phosphate acetyltransferase
MAVPDSATAFLSTLISRARTLHKRIVFPEGGDPRVIAAATRLAREGIVKPVLLGPEPAAQAQGVSFVDPSAAEHARKYAGLLYERRKTKGMTQMEAQQMARQPLYLAALMVAWAAW